MNKENPLLSLVYLSSSGFPFKTYFPSYLLTPMFNISSVLDILLKENNKHEQKLLTQIWDYFRCLIQTAHNDRR